MHIIPSHKRRLDSPIAGISGDKTVAADADATALVFDSAAPTNGITSAPPLASTPITITTSATASSSTQAPPASDADAAASSASKSSLPVGTVVGACVGAFVGLAVLIVIFLAWYKRSTDKMSASAARLNAAGHRAQQRADARAFHQLEDEKPQRGGVAPGAPPPSTEQDSDEKNFSMFKKSPSIRTAYTTRDDDNAYDLPKLDFTRYHPNLAAELSLEQPEKPFAPGGVSRAGNAVSWDGETLGDNSFLSMHSVRNDSGSMSPTMAMAKMTPPATASPLHRWESAEVLNTDDEIAAAAGVAVSRNPFADMVEEQPRARNNPFFNARDTATNPNRTSRARSRSNSRTSRGASIIRPDSRGTITQGSMNPFLDMHEAMPTHTVDITRPEQAYNPPSFHKNNNSVASGSSLSAFGSERAMASLIAALDLTPGQVEDRLRIVSMQGSTYSAYSNDEGDIVPEFPLPPGASATRPAGSP